MSYTQRIQRPLIWYLNPWTDASDTLNLRTGNPYLNPELNHAVELAHSINTEKGLSINSSFYWRYTDNAIEYLSSINEEGVTLMMPENIAQRKTYGVNLNLSGQLNKNWNMNGGTDIRYIDVENPAQDLRSNGITWNMNLNTTYKLPKSYSVQLNGNYGSGWISLQNRNSGWLWYGLAAKKEFWDNKASVTLAVNNPFSNSFAQTGKRSDTTFISESESKIFNRSARLSFEWRFGQMSSEGGKRGKKIKNDDAAGR